MGFPQLTRAQALAAASVGGRAEWLTIGMGKHTPHDKAIRQLQGISDDPIVLGHACGFYLHRAETHDRYYLPAAELLREAGADEQTAQDMLDWNRQQDATRSSPVPAQFDVPGQQ